MIARLVGGAECGASAPFSVCAHPFVTPHGPEHEPRFYPRPDSAGNLVGMRAKIRLLSDSGDAADLDRAVEREVASDTLACYNGILPEVGNAVRGPLW
jgi:hypothetical protein